MKPILVVGATGKIGKHLVKKLVGKKYPVRALIHKKENEVLLKGLDVELVYGDLGDQESLGKIVQGVDKIFLTISSSEVQDDLETNLITVAMDMNVKQIVKISVLGASKDSNILLARNHCKIEKALINSGVGYTILRPNYFVQNILGDLESIKNEGKIYTSMKEAPISMIDARDIADVAFECLINDQHLGKTYTLTGPKPVSYNKIAKQISDFFGKKIQCIPISYDEQRFNLRKLGIPSWYADDLVELSRAFNQGSGKLVTKDVKSITLNKPRSLQKFIEECLSQYVKPDEISVQL